MSLNSLNFFHSRVEVCAPWIWVVSMTDWPIEYGGNDAVPVAVPGFKSLEVSLFFPLEHSFWEREPPRMKVNYLETSRLERLHVGTLVDSSRWTQHSGHPCQGTRYVSEGLGLSEGVKVSWTLQTSPFANWIITMWPRLIPYGAKDSTSWALLKFLTHKILNH